jgi:mono/diheme cytochrome c family protein
VRLLVLVAASLFAQDIRAQSAFVHVPVKCRPKRNPLAGDASAPVAGEKLFQQHCAQCHGSAAEGGKKVPPLASPEVAQATPGEIFWILSNGVVRHGMPSWSRLPDVQRWQIVAFLTSLNAPPAQPSPR